MHMCVFPCTVHIHVHTCTHTMSSVHVRVYVYASGILCICVHSRSYYSTRRLLSTMPVEMVIMILWQSCLREEHIQTQKTRWVVYVASVLGSLSSMNTRNNIMTFSARTKLIILCVLAEERDAGNKAMVYVDHGKLYVYIHVCVDRLQLMMMRGPTQSWPTCWFLRLYSNIPNCTKGCTCDLWPLIEPLCVACGYN